MFESERNYCEGLYWFIFSVLLPLCIQPQLQGQTKGEFKFNSPQEWETTEETNTYIITGTHQFSIDQDHHIWIFLRDRRRNLYLQFPPVELINEVEWEATSVTFGKGILDIWAVEFDSLGNQEIQEMIDTQHWQAIAQLKIKGFSGYRKLASYRVKNVQLPGFKEDFEPPTDKGPVVKKYLSDKSRKTPKLTSDSKALLIADFESGEDPIRYGGKIQSWNSGKGLEIEIGYRFLKDEGAAYGKFAASVTLKETGKKDKNGWSGGGLVVVFKDEESGVDLSSYTHLQFDIKATKESKLKNTWAKLEDTGEGLRPERALAAYGVAISAEWQTIKISLTEFANLKKNDPADWKKLDLTAVTKFVTVSVRNEDFRDTKGTLLVDNLRFSK